jgi:thioredoxin 1
VPGNLVEFPRNRENSACCGGGGGSVWKEPEAESEIKDTGFRLEKEIPGPLLIIRRAKRADLEGGNMSKVVEVTDRSFEEEVLKSDLPTEVDFWAPWCGPCLIVSPIYDKLAEEYEGKFKFCKINVDENQDTARKYQIMSIPMQMFFSNGEKVDEILGAVPEHTIRTTVASLLENSATD